MKVLIVSDTHGRSEKLDEVIEREAPFQAMVHCGDVEGEEDYIRARLNCSCYMVAGNNDWFSDLNRELEVMLGDYRTFITHGNVYGVNMGLEGIREEGRSRGARFVMFGHTHHPVIQEYPDITILNPGSLTYPRQIGRQPSYIVMEINSDGEVHLELKYLEK